MYLQAYWQTYLQSYFKGICKVLMKKETPRRTKTSSKKHEASLFFKRKLSSPESLSRLASRYVNKLAHGLSNRFVNRTRMKMASEQQSLEAVNAASDAQNLTRDHLIAAKLYSQMLCQLTIAGLS